MIKKCDCKHEYQDSKYGKGLRVHNLKADGIFVCTVCRQEKGDLLNPPIARKEISKDASCKRLQ